MSGAKRFYSSLRNCVSFRKLIKLLKNIFHLDKRLHSAAHHTDKIFLDCMFYNENNFFKSCSLVVIHGKVQKGMFLSVYRIHLLQSAILASHACRNYNKGWL